VDESIGAKPSTTLWKSTEMTRPEGLKSEAGGAEKDGVLGEGIAERDGVLWEGMFPSPTARGSGERC